jgi:hypothetical protein
MTGVRLTTSEIRRAIDLASAAPSVLNSQPWRFEATPTRIGLYADRARQLRVTDPAGRQMIISCGAALLNLRLAVATISRLPVVRLHAGAPRDHLADVTFGEVRAPTVAERQLADAIPDRRTNRRPFTPEKPPVEACNEMAAAARAEGARLVLLGPAEAERVLRVVHEADAQQRADTAVRAEITRWTANRADDEGIAPQSLGPVDLDEHPVVRDFALGVPVAGRRASRFDAVPTIALLVTELDDVADWLLAGQALQRTLLTATTYGLASSFLNQPLEVGDLRPLVNPPDEPGFTQMILRLGYAPEAPATPRRTPRDILGRADLL